MRIENPITVLTREIYLSRVYYIYTAVSAEAVMVTLYYRLKLFFLHCITHWRFQISQDDKMIRKGYIRSVYRRSGTPLITLIPIDWYLIGHIYVVRILISMNQTRTQTRLELPSSLSRTAPSSQLERLPGSDYKLDPNKKLFKWSLMYARSVSPRAHNRSAEVPEMSTDVFSNNIPLTAFVVLTPVISTSLVQRTFRVIFFRPIFLLYVS